MFGSGGKRVRVVGEGLRTGRRRHREGVLCLPVLRSFPLAPAAFVEARRFVKEAAAPTAPRQVLDDAMLLTSELVTNAVGHAGRSSDDPIELTVFVDSDVLRVSVRDRGPGFDPRQVRARSEEGGWGLDLVERLSSRWGVGRHPDGSEVWFEIDLPDAPGTPARA